MNSILSFSFLHLCVATITLANYIRSSRLYKVPGCVVVGDDKKKRRKCVDGSILCSSCLHVEKLAYTQSQKATTIAPCSSNSLIRCFDNIL